MACVTVWKQPYSPGDAPLGTFSLERAAALAGLTPTWLDFVLLNAKRATGIWDTAAWHIEGAARTVHVSAAEPASAQSRNIVRSGARR
jgi:hypothetical protein